MLIRRMGVVQSTCHQHSHRFMASITQQDPKCKPCPFCEVISKGTRPLYAREKGMVVFETKFKVAETHLLIVPERHIEQAEALRDAELLKRMQEVGLNLKAERLMIHPWPFNSVAHFHVHLLRGNFSNWYRDWTHSGFRPFSLKLSDAIVDATLLNWSNKR